MQTYLSKILNNCDEVTQHVLQKKEVEFSLRKQIEIKIHVMMCRCCKNFEKQSEVMESMDNFLVVHKPISTVQLGGPTKYLVFT